MRSKLERFIHFTNSCSKKCTSSLYSRDILLLGNVLPDLACIFELASCKVFILVMYFKCANDKNYKYKSSMSQNSKNNTVESTFCIRTLLKLVNVSYQTHKATIIKRDVLNVM